MFVDDTRGGTFRTTCRICLLALNPRNTVYPASGEPSSSTAQDRASALARAVSHLLLFKEQKHAGPRRAELSGSRQGGHPFTPAACNRPGAPTDRNRYPTG